MKYIFNIFLSFRATAVEQIVRSLRIRAATWQWSTLRWECFVIINIQFNGAIGFWKLIERWKWLEDCWVASDECSHVDYNQDNYLPSDNSHWIYSAIVHTVHYRSKCSYIDHTYEGRQLQNIEKIGWFLSLSNFTF